MRLLLGLLLDWSRDFPERYGQFYSPEEVFGNLGDAARQYRVRKLRISGAEPTLGKEHLLKVLELVEASEFDQFILETNGMLFGVDRGYVREIPQAEGMLGSVTIEVPSMRL
jgi:uncharacterized Fe-S cluster-containing radical SAM superfamily protein